MSIQKSDSSDSVSSPPENKYLTEKQNKLNDHISHLQQIEEDLFGESSPPEERIERLGSPERDELVLRHLCVERELSPKEIAQKLDVTEERIRTSLREHDIDRPSRIYLSRDDDGYLRVIHDHHEVSVHRLTFCANEGGFEAVADPEIEIHHEWHLPIINNPTNLAAVESGAHQSVHQSGIADDDVVIDPFWVESETETGGGAAD